jgi:hypothetical protein
MNKNINIFEGTISTYLFIYNNNNNNNNNNYVTKDK